MYWSCYREIYGGVVHDLLARKRFEGAGKDPYKEFLAYCLSRKESFSQIGQDLFVLWALGDKKGGFFVEIGAFDGKTLSNTFLLEKNFGWNGILSEPNPDVVTALRSSRSAMIDTRCVDRCSGEEVRFDIATQPELSRIATSQRDIRDRDGSRETGRLIESSTVSLDDLLNECDAPQSIDYISIDIEGKELDALSGLTFGMWNFDVLTIEHNYGAERSNIDNILYNNGYIKVFTEFSRFDSWFISKEVADRNALT